MRSGVVLCAAPSPEQFTRHLVRLGERLQTKGVPVLQCSENVIIKEPDRITDFVTQNNLERLLVVSDFFHTSVTEALQFSTQRAHLGRLAVTYLDYNLTSGNRADVNDDQSLIVALTNLARLEHADHISDAVLRTVLGPAKVSRRQLLVSVPRALRVESDIPIILQDVCTSRSGSCTYCRDACPVKAISPTKDSVVIDDRICVECGACARECPIGAIQSPSISDAQFVAILNTLSSEGPKSTQLRLLLTCPAGIERLAHATGGNGGVDTGIVPVAIPCVAAIGSMHQLWAASLGIDLVTICPDASCPRNPAVLTIQRHTDSSRGALESLGERETTVQHLILTPGDSMLSKLPPALKRSKVRTRAELSGTRREASLQALRTLHEGGDGSILLVEDHMLPFFDVAVDIERCTFCGVCEKECPEKAISFVKEAASSSLVVDSSLCGGCRVCERICPESAIKVVKDRDLAGILEARKETKAKDEEATCARCGAPIGPKRTLAAIERKLTNERFPPAILESLHICSKCKQKPIQHTI
jgi:ferredoxin